MLTRPGSDVPALRAALSAAVAAPLGIADAPHRVTVSIGAAVDVRAEDAFATASRAMRDAKRHRASCRV